MNFKEQVLKAVELTTINNRTLLAIRDSALGEIITSIMLNKDNYIPDIQDIETDSLNTYIQELLTEDDNVSLLIEDFAKDHAVTVDGFISSIRTDINPAIAELSGALSAQLRAMDSNKDAWADDYKIIQVDVPDIIVDDPQLFTLSDYSKKHLPLPFTVMTALDPGELSVKGDEVYEILATGDEVHDRSLQRWLVEANTANLALLYNRVFAKPTNKQIITDIFSVNAPVLNMDMACFMYLMCVKLMKDPASGVVNMSLADYNNKLWLIKGMAGIYLSRGIFAYKASLRMNKLVLSRKDKEIYVMKEAYAGYLDKGGTIQSILGSVIGQTERSSLDDMINAIFDDTKTYTAYKNIKNAGTAKSRSSAVRTMAFNLFNSLFTEDSMTELEKLYSNNGYNEFRKVVIEKAKHTAMRLSDSDTMDVNIVALKMVTRSRFFFTDAENFLMSMIHIREADPDLTIDEVRFLATTQYVARFLATQVEYNKLY